MTGPRWHRQRGSAALLGLLFGLATIAVLSAVTSLASVHVRSSERYRVETEARAAAASGLAAGLSALKSGGEVEQVSGTVGRGAYQARCSRQDSRFLIESTGTARSETGVLLSCRMRVSGRLEGGRPRYEGCAVEVVTQGPKR